MRIAGWSIRPDRWIPYQGDEKRSTVQEWVIHTEKGIASGLTKAPQLVLVSPKSTNTPQPFIKNISPMKNVNPVVYDAYNRTIAKDQNNATTLRTNWSNGNTQIIVNANTNPMEASPTSTQAPSRTSTSSLEDSLAKRFQSLENEVASRTPEELSSMMSCELSKKSTPGLCYLKMSKDSFLTTVEELSKPSSPRLQSWGMLSNGKCLTQRILVSHRIGKECSLSDILEDSVDERYFLSEQATEKILKQGDFTRLTKDGYHRARMDEKKSSIQGTHITKPEGKTHAMSVAHQPLLDASLLPNVKD